jgi:hypothetical protein
MLEKLEISDGNFVWIGSKISKPNGYGFDGIVVSIFQTTSGQYRIVAELENNGMLHIFSPNQLIIRN